MRKGEKPKWSAVTFFGYRPVPREAISPAVRKIMDQLDQGKKPTSQYVSGREKANRLLASAAITVACLAGSGLLFYLASTR